MDLTEIPDEAYDGSGSAPDFDEMESPDSLLKGGPTRERLLDVVTGLRTPTKVSDIANRADCDTETARDYLTWFDELGMVRRHAGRPVRFERNDAYFEWRRINRIHEEYSEQEIVDALTETLEEVEHYRTEFDAETPEDVSLVEASRDRPTEVAWEALSEWESLERRAALLDAARRGPALFRGKPGSIDA